MDSATARRRIIELAQTLVITIVVFVVIQAFVAQPFQVKQVSMQQTLQPDEYVLVDKLSPRWSGYGRGDIVVFVPPPSWVNPEQQPYIKRVVGVGGDVVEIRGDGNVYVNDVRLDEPYVYPVNGRPQKTEGVPAGHRVDLADGELFVMGDHRSNSLDSRRYGPIRADGVIVRAWLRYWPIPALGLVGGAAHPELGGTGR